MKAIKRIIYLSTWELFKSIKETSNDCGNLFLGRLVFLGGSFLKSMNSICYSSITISKAKTSRKTSTPLPPKLSILRMLLDYQSFVSAFIHRISKWPLSPPFNATTDICITSRASSSCFLYLNLPFFVIYLITIWGPSISISSVPLYSNITL